MPAEAATITKREAVRRALEALGNDSMPAALKDWVKKEFGFDIDPNHISSYKSQLVGGARKKKKKPGRKPGPKKKAAISKADAVRAALAKLGRNAKPAPIQKFVADGYGIDMKLNAISAYKTMLKKSKKRRGRPAAAARSASTTPARNLSTGVSLADVRAVKQLADRLGARTLFELAQVLSP